MPDEKANARNRRKRERDRAAGLVRFEDLIQADRVGEAKRRIADLRNEPDKTVGGEGDAI